MLLKAALVVAGLVLFSPTGKIAPRAPTGYLTCSDLM